jgi:DNA-binding transcriptional regulator PaaX
MADEEILHRIQTLVEEEHAVRSAGAAVDDERLRHLEETLDQCWDLLRQRRAQREFGENPSEAQVRPAGTVEHYQQ